MISNNISNTDLPRPGCKDMWFASMLEEATYTEGNDIPICTRCTGQIPKDLIGYDDAKALHKKLSKKKPDYFIDKYVHFYIDDQKFDGIRSSICHHPKKLIEMLRHFSGVISPDFSTFADFPHFVKGNSFFRMRTFDYFFQKNGIPVIHNVRWGTSETWSFCFDGIPINGIIAIGIVASGINKTINRKYFKDGLLKAIELLSPHTIILYGSDNYDLFDDLRRKGINIVAFPSKTNLAYSKEGGK